MSVQQRITNIRKQLNAIRRTMVSDPDHAKLHSAGDFITQVAAMQAEVATLQVKWNELKLVNTYGEKPS